MRIIELYGGGSGGGAARHLESLIPQLAAAGEEIHFVSLGRDDLHPKGSTRHQAGGLGALTLLARLRPDVVHTHGVRANFLGRLFSRLSGVPTVTTVHSFLAKDYLSAETAAVALQVDSATLASSRFTICVSHALRNDLIYRGALPGSVLVVPNGIATPPAPDPEWLRRAAPGRPLLAVAARLHPAKGVDLAIEALDLLPEATLAVLGEGAELRKLQRLANTRGVEERTHFLGYVQEFPAVVAGADLLLVPSRAEGFGLAALEAMAQGVPVVATRTGALPELIEGAGILVAPDDPRALAQGIESALASRDRLRRASQERARQFTLEETARKTLAILREATEGSSCA